MVSRLLIWIVLGLLAFWWLKKRLRGGRDKPVPPQAPGTAAPTTTEMVQCAHCGVHLPRGEALFDDRYPYCGQPHRLAGPRPGPRP